MRLSSMRYKNYTWPHNPETFVVEYRRQMAAHKVPFGGCVLQDLGVNCRILRGEGEFAGPGAYEEFKALAAVFQEPGAGDADASRVADGPGVFRFPVRDGGATAGLCTVQLCVLGG